MSLAKQRLLATQSIFSSEALTQKAQGLWLKKMPHSSSYIRSVNFGYPIDNLSCLVAKSKQECANNILENDPLHLVFSFHYDKILTVKAECRLYTLPPEGSHFVNGRAGLRSATFKGDEAKVLKQVSSYMDKAKELIKKTVADGVATKQEYAWENKI